MEDTSYCECRYLRATLVRKLEFQRRLAIGTLAQLFTDREENRVTVANRFSEVVSRVAQAEREQLFRLQRALHLWKLQTPLSFPSLNDLNDTLAAQDLSRN